MSSTSSDSSLSSSSSSFPTDSSDSVKKYFYASEQDCDLVVSLRQHHFFVRKSILEASCSFFHNVFSSTQFEKYNPPTGEQTANDDRTKLDELPLPDSFSWTSDSLDAFFEFVHFRSTPQIAHVKSLAEMAHYFDCEDLKPALEDWLVKNYAKVFVSLFEALLFADRNHLDKFADHLMTEMSEMSSESWKSLERPENQHFLSSLSRKRLESLLKRRVSCKFHADQKVAFRKNGEWHRGLFFSSLGSKYKIYGYDDCSIDEYEADDVWF